MVVFPSIMGHGCIMGRSGYILEIELIELTGRKKSKMVPRCLVWTTHLLGRESLTEKQVREFRGMRPPRRYPFNTQMQSKAETWGQMKTRGSSSLGWQGRRFKAESWGSKKVCNILESSTWVSNSSSMTEPTGHQTSSFKSVSASHMLLGTVCHGGGQGVACFAGTPVWERSRNPTERVRGVT